MALFSGFSPGIKISEATVQLGGQGSALGAVAVVSGDEVEGGALRSKLGSISGLSLVGRVGKDGEVRASL